jgi:hypothetical protein
MCSIVSTGICESQLTLGTAAAVTVGQQAWSAQPSWPALFGVCQQLALEPCTLHQRYLLQLQQLNEAGCGAQHAWQ